MKRFIHLISAILIIFITSCANAFLGGLANLAASVISGNNVNSAINGMHDVLEHSRQIIIGC